MEHDRKIVYVWYRRDLTLLHAIADCNIERVHRMFKTSGYKNTQLQHVCVAHHELLKCVQREPTSEHTLFEELHPCSKQVNMLKLIASSYLSGRTDGEIAAELIQTTEMFS